MYILEKSRMKPGDIILTRSSSRESVLIRELTQNEYSHAILYVSASSCIESDGLGVQSQNVQRLVFENANDVVVLRLRSKDLEYLLSEVIVFARQKIGTEYSTPEARLARHEQKIKAKEENRQFCTRFVGQAYSHAGIDIVANPDYCTPQEILESPLLNPINDIVREASEKEMEFASDKNSPLEKQKEIHNHIFETTRNITGQDIQTFEQLAKYVLDNPERDEEISNIVEQSGYLTMWKTDIERNPWHYDYKEFLKHYTNLEQRKNVGYYFATTESETRTRFITTLEALEFGYLFHKQRYFKEQIELYKKLIDLSEQREFVGILAIKN